MKFDPKEPSRGLARAPIEAQGTIGGRPVGGPPGDAGGSRGEKEPTLQILVIDDEEDILALCRVTLARDGHDVLEAATADEGLRTALVERPDLIVLDVMLPHRDGFSLLEELVTSRETREIPVVLLTARARPQDRARAWGSGASGYVTKPFTPATLNETVRLVGRMTPEERSAVRQHALTALEPSLYGGERADAG